MDNTTCTGNDGSDKVYPVAFAFHGHGGLAGTWTTVLGALINQHQFIGVYPQGYRAPQLVDEFGQPVSSTWNLGA